MDAHLKAHTESLAEDCFLQKKSTKFIQRLFFTAWCHLLGCKTGAQAEVAGQCQGKELKMWMDVFLRLG